MYKPLCEKDQDVQTSDHRAKRPQLLCELRTAKPSELLKQTCRIEHLRCSDFLIDSHNITGERKDYNFSENEQCDQFITQL